MKRVKRVPRPCAECDTYFIPPRKTSRFCSVACRRAVDARVCKNGHDLTLPGATRVQRHAGGRTASRCLQCEQESTKRYRRKKGVKPREDFLSEARKTPEERRETKRLNAERARRRAGIRPRAEIARKEQRKSGAKPRTATKIIDAPRELPTELSRAWGRAGHGSQMRRKFPTREALVAAYRKGEVPDPPTSRMEP